MTIKPSNHRIIETLNHLTIEPSSNKTIKRHKSKAARYSTSTIFSKSVKTKLKQSSRNSKYHIPNSKDKLSSSFQPTNLELSLFGIILFLIPTNLFLSLDKSHAFVNGLLVDYLIPKLYLSDILIGVLFIAWITRCWRGIFTFLASIPSYLTPPKAKTNQNYLITLFNSNFFLLIAYGLLLIALILSTILSPNPYSSFWFLIKLVEFSLLSVWIKNSISSTYQIQKPIIITLVFQAFLTFFQWVQKRSILGYLFLGETSLRTSSQIAKTSLGGELRPLPYGTAAHPNILAGVFAIFVLILLINQPIKSLLKKPIILITFLLSLIAIILTQSISALVALGLGLLLYLSPSFPKKIRLLPFLATLICLAALLFYSFVVKPDSYTRRMQLNQIGLQTIIHSPIVGSGPNNFTVTMSNYGSIPGTTRFLQPVHNIYLLLLSETGVVGLTALLLLSAKLIHSFDKRKSLSINLAIPLLMVLIIGIFDHYPYSLQTGQLLVTLTVGLILTSLNPKNRANFKVIYK